MSQRSGIGINQAGAGSGCVFAEGCMVFAGSGCSKWKKQCIWKLNKKNTPFTAEKVVGFDRGGCREKGCVVLRPQARTEGALSSREACSQGGPGLGSLGSQDRFPGRERHQLALGCSVPRWWARGPSDFRLTSSSSPCPAVSWSRGRRADLRG